MSATGRPAVWAPAVWALATVTALTGCVDLADERAANEARIGQRRGAGLTVAVQDGLAAVRVLEPGRLELWPQAPGLTVDLDAEAAGEWVIEVRNALPDALLSGVAATPEPRDLPTHKAWRVTLPAGPSRVDLAAPRAAAVEPFRIIAFADTQEALPEAGDFFAKMAAQRDIEFGLVSGDLTDMGYPDEVRLFQRRMEVLPFPLYATLGNHELGESSTAPAFHRYFGRASFSFPWRGARFTLVDSGTATLAPRTWRSLHTWLAQGRDGFHLFMTHMPPLDVAGLRNNAFASRAEAHKLLGTLARAGVDLTIHGHVHSFHAYAQVGMPAFITGGGGGIGEAFDGIDRHFLVIEIDPVAQTALPAVVRVGAAE
ncbi:MAG: metallophosphoesterase [Myxococcales bacterium]|nr:metallophosphoesterase [Myxococcales bacterium]MCB9525110.1 metallophosphoesterase [Myxococcales bacterium]